MCVCQMDFIYIFKVREVRPLEDDHCMVTLKFQRLLNYGYFNITTLMVNIAKST